MHEFPSIDHDHGTESLRDMQHQIDMIHEQIAMLQTLLGVKPGNMMIEDITSLHEPSGIRVIRITPLEVQEDA